MATLDDLTVVEKQCLNLSSLHVYHTKKELEKTSLFLKIEIGEFPKLKNGISYSKSILDEGLILKVLKKKTTVILEFKFRACKYGICHIRYDENTLSRAVLAEKVRHGEFIVRLSPGVINEPQNAQLKRGFLCLELDIFHRSIDGIIRLVTESEVLKKEASMLFTNEEGRGKTEEETLMNDITEKLNFSKFSDFRIKTEGYTEYVNKSVIAARSKFFFDYLKENPDSEEIEIDTSREALKTVMKYMNCGRISVQNLMIMIEVIELAEQLQMEKFCELCNAFLNI